MNEPSVTLELDLDPSKLSEVQGRLHGMTSEDEVDRAEVESIFYPHIPPLSRSPHMRVKATYVMEDDLHTYKIDRKMHYITNSYFQQRLRQVRIKQEYNDRFEVAWPKNIALNIILRSIITIDSSPWQGHDLHWLNIWYDKLLPEKWDKSTVDIILGNVPFLTEFSTFLPAYNLYPILPWDYTRGEGHALPIHKMSKNSTINHSFDLRLELHNLLRVRTRSSPSAEWVNIPPSQGLLRKILEDPLDLQPPSMWSYCYKVDPIVLTGLTHQETSYVYDVVELDPINSYAEGSTISVPLDCDMSCVGIYWCIENTVSSKLNNYSNYTTSVDGDGWGPLKNHHIMYGGVTRSPKVDAGHSGLIDSLIYGRPSSSDGYYSESITHNTLGSQADTTVNFKTMCAKLVLEIDDMDPFINNSIECSSRAIEDFDEEIESLVSTTTPSKKEEIYKIRVRLLVLRETRYVDGKCRFT